LSVTVKLVRPKPILGWSLTTLREKLIKIRAKVAAQTKDVAFQLTEVVAPRELLARIWNGSLLVPSLWLWFKVGSACQRVRTLSPGVRGVRRGPVSIFPWRRRAHGGGSGLPPNAVRSSEVPVVRPGGEIVARNLSRG
jgi:hypothetical protein